jgi:hypothetical protein
MRRPAVNLPVPALNPSARTPCVWLPATGGVNSGESTHEPSLDAILVRIDSFMIVLIRIFRFKPPQKREHDTSPQAFTTAGDGSHP